MARYTVTAEKSGQWWSLQCVEVPGAISQVKDLAEAHIITEAIARNIGNAALIKVNQIGTITETLEAQRICREAGYAQLVSHRSGETPDTFIADLTVATGAGHLKTGAPARGERVAKYNRLMEIAEANPQLPYGLPASTIAGK